MLRIWFVLWCLLWVPAEAWAAQERSPVLLVLGDSLSSAYGMDRRQGWVFQLQRRLEAKRPRWRVMNASISGETTQGGLSRLPDLLARFRPCVVVIELGANDGLRGVALPVIRDTLTQLVRKSKAAGAKVLLVGNHLPVNFGKRYAQGFFAIFQEVARRESVALVPFMLASIAEDRRLVQADGLHPTAEAQAQVLDNIWPQLESLLFPRRRDVSEMENLMIFRESAVKNTMR